MSQVISNPSPKSRFQMVVKNSVMEHRDMIALPQFERAIDFALLHYQRQLVRSSAENFNAAGANQFKQVGAIEFVEVLRNLAETPTLLDKATGPTNLNHQA